VEVIGTGERIGAYMAGAQPHSMHNTSPTMAARSPSPPLSHQLQQQAQQLGSQRAGSPPLGASPCTLSLSGAHALSRSPIGAVPTLPLLSPVPAGLMPFPAIAVAGSPRGRRAAVAAAAEVEAATTGLAIIGGQAIVGKAHGQA